MEILHRSRLVAVAISCWGSAIVCLGSLRLRSAPWTANVAQRTKRTICQHKSKWESAIVWLGSLRLR